MGQGGRLIFRVQDVHRYPLFFYHVFQVRQVVFLGFAEFDVDVNDSLRLCVMVEFFDFLEVL